MVSFVSIKWTKLLIFSQTFSCGRNHERSSLEREKNMEAKNEIWIASSLLLNLHSTINMAAEKRAEEYMATLAFVFDQQEVIARLCNFDRRFLSECFSSLISVRCNLENITELTSYTPNFEWHVNNASSSSSIVVVTP